MSGPNADHPTPLSAKLLAYYREMVAVHTDGRITGTCLICGVHRCQDWRFAQERLLCAGESIDGYARWADLVQPSEADR